MARQWVQTKGKDDAENCDEKEVSCDCHAARHLVVDAREVVHDLRHGRRHVSSHTQTPTHRLTHSSLRFVFLFQNAKRAKCKKGTQKVKQSKRENEKRQKEPKKKSKKEIALAGTRTRIDRVAGDHSTLRPPVPFLFQNNKFPSFPFLHSLCFVQTRLASFARSSESNPAPCFCPHTAIKMHKPG